MLPTQGYPISDEVQKAIELRARSLKQRVDGDDANLQTINYYFTSRTPWARMISSVDTAEEGSQLAKDNILGLIQDDNDSRIPSGTEISQDFGVRPKAGITSIQVTSLGRFGALRDITVSFKCFSREQLDVYEKLFMRPGATVLLEWGHSIYLTEQGGVFNVNQMGPGLRQRMFDGTRKTINGVYDEIKILRQRYNYEYDAAFSKIANFSWTFEGTGPSYDCKVTLVSSGEIIGGIDSTLALPNKLAQKYREQGDYSNPNAPLSFDLEDFAPETAFLLTPADLTPEEQQEQQLEAFEQVTNNLEQARARQLIPFIDSRTDWELSSLLKCFLYQDLHYVYHSSVIASARLEALKDAPGIYSSNLLENDITYDNLVRFTDIDPNNAEDIDTITGTGVPWIVVNLGISATMLTVFFKEQVELTAEQLSLDEIDELEEELGMYTRYRGMSYITYRDLLQFLNKMMLNDTSQYLLSFDTSVDQTFFLNEYIQSLDPRLCLLPYDVHTLVTAEGTQHATKEGSFRKASNYNSVMDIALNISMLYDVASTTRGSLKDFIDGVNREIEDATGGILDLDINYSEEDAKYYLVDRRRFIKQELPTIKLLGSQSIVRTFKLSTAISKDITSAIAISLGDSSARDEISKSLLNFYKGISDRNMPRRELIPLELLNQPDEKVNGGVSEQELKRTLVYITLESLYAHKQISDIVLDNAKSAYSTYIVESTSPEQLGGVILPYTLNLTLDGISGLRVMDSFQIDSNILPRSYIKSSEVGNLITGIDMNLDRGGWTVNLKSQYYNLNRQPNITGLREYLPPAKITPDIANRDTVYSILQDYESGLILYSSDPDALEHDLFILTQWVQTNFNQSIQPQVLGMLVDLVDKLAIPDPQTGELGIGGLGANILVTSTYRSLAEQAALQNQDVVAAVGTSMHNWGAAIDFNIFGVRSRQPLYKKNTPSQDEWNALGIGEIVKPYGFQYPIKNDPIHIEYDVSGRAVLNDYVTGKVVDRLSRPITNASGSVIDSTIHPDGRLAVDLRKYNNNPGLELPKYQPTNITTSYLEQQNITQQDINPANTTNIDVNVIPEDLL